jgi:excisionase family DNA binding protein
VNDTLDHFLTVDEACEFLRIRKSWLYQNHEHSGMPSHRIGRKLVFKKNELSDWVTNGG